MRRDVSSPIHCRGADVMYNRRAAGSDPLTPYSLVCRVPTFIYRRIIPLRTKTEDAKPTDYIGEMSREPSGCGTHGSRLHLLLVGGRVSLGVEAVNGPTQAPQRPDHLWTVSCCRSPPYQGCPPGTYIFHSDRLAVAMLDKGHTVSQDLRGMSGKRVTNSEGPQGSLMDWLLTRVSLSRRQDRISS